MHAGLTISVVIPAYNEERGIGTVLEALPDCVDEVVVVDNNSKDHTATSRAVWEPRRSWSSVRDMVGHCGEGLRRPPRTWWCRWTPTAPTHPNRSPM